MNKHFPSEGSRVADGAVAALCLIDLRQKLRFFVRSHNLRMDTVANVNDLLGHSESFGSLTIEKAEGK